MASNVEIANRFGHGLLSVASQWRKSQATQNAEIAALKKSAPSDGRKSSTGCRRQTRAANTASASRANAKADARPTSAAPNAVCSCQGSRRLPVLLFFPIPNNRPTFAPRTSRIASRLTTRLDFGDAGRFTTKIVPTPQTTNPQRLDDGSMLARRTACLGKFLGDGSYGPLFYDFPASSDGFSRARTRRWHEGPDFPPGGGLSGQIGETYLSSPRRSSLSVASHDRGRYRKFSPNGPMRSRRVPRVFVRHPVS